jgi:hypothetical protein
MIYRNKNKDDEGDDWSILTLSLRDKNIVFGGIYT